MIFGKTPRSKPTAERRTRSGRKGIILRNSVNSHNVFGVKHGITVQDNLWKDYLDQVGENGKHVTIATELDILPAIAGI